MNLQVSAQLREPLPHPLVAVLSFFVGGLVATHFLLPLVLGGGA